MSELVAIKKNILLVGNFLSSEGGNRTIAEELAERLGSAGYSIITTSSQRSRPLRLLEMILTAWSRRQEYQIAYVEVYSGAAFLWAEAVCGVLHLMKKPFLLALHGGNLPIFAQRWPDRVKRLLEDASKVTAPSRYLLEAMRSYRSDIRLVPNLIELEHYSFRSRSKPSPHLVWLRAFHAIYNPEMAVHVIALLQKSFPTVHLTMIGPDKHDGSFQKTQRLVEELAMQDHIAIVPGIPKSRVPEYLAQADIFMNTTNVDNTPVSMIEALACGLCVVSTNVGGIPYLLEEEKNALLGSPSDPQAMAHAIHRILTEPGLAARLSFTARCKAEQFDWSVILPVWENLFQEVIAR
jgi:glycosyltransferase involved in cell wall biosynthesis